MKGSKGGKRDRLISILFSNKNAKAKQENEELEKIKLSAVDKHINKGNFNSTPLEVDLQEVIIEKNDQKTSLSKNEEKEITKDNNKELIITEQTKTKEEELKQVEIKEEEIVNQIPEDVFEKEENKHEEELEFKIVDAIETILKEDLYELEELEYEFKVLNQKQETEIEYEEIEKLKEQVQGLLRKFEIIKEKYEIYRNSDKNDYIELDDNFIYDLVIQYKKETKENSLIGQINEQVEKIEEYIGVIEKIINIETNTGQLEEELDEKLEKFEIRDEEFENLKIEYENVEDINKLIDTFNRKQDEIIKDLEYKIKTSEEITKKVETTTNYVTNFNKLIQMALLISVSKKIPPTPTGNLLKTTLMLSAVNAAAHFITKKETSKLVTKVKYTDYSKNIKEAANNTVLMINKIDDAFLDIETIKEKFEKECGEYKDQIEEYDELIKNIDKVEKELKQKQEIAKKYNRNFENILHMNNQKIKRLEEIKTN